jgi:hypothetical protein
MTGDEYLRGVLARITAPTGPSGPGPTVRTALLPTLQQWAGSQLVDVLLSGSYAKGTAIVGGTDVDLFVSLREDTTQTLKEVYDSLLARLQSVGYTAKRQNVSVGITHGKYKVDVVPGKRQNGWSDDHSIWVNRQNTWQKTNVNKHIANVQASGRSDVVRLMKRWKQKHNVDMPSFALELATLKAQTRSFAQGLDNQVWAALTFLRDKLTTAVLLDPANSNNDVADEMTSAEKSAVARAAGASMGQSSWGDIIS